MKFLNKICFIDSKDYINKKGTSPYLYVYSIEKSVIKYVDINGNYNQMFLNKAWAHKNIEILDPPPKHLIKDFIKNILK